MSHDRFYRPINLAVELGSNFAEKIGRFYRSSVIGLRVTDTEPKLTEFDKWV